MSFQLNWRGLQIGGRVAAVVTGPYFETDANGDLMPTWSFDPFTDHAHEIAGDYLQPTTHAVLDDPNFELDANEDVMPRA